MEIQLLLKEGEKKSLANGILAVTSGRYDGDNDVISLYLPIMWQKTKTEPDFIAEFGSVVNHEVLHAEVQKAASREVIRNLPSPSTAQEYIVNRLNDEPITSLRMLSYIIKDMDYKHGKVVEAKYRETYKKAIRFLLFAALLDESVLCYFLVRLLWK
jgi:hypothetical protein